MDPEAFYDELANDYHLNYRDWPGAVRRQGAVLATLIRDVFGADPATVLDCTCGITWHEPEATSHHQPLVTARRP